ncbi:hypothetical protein P1X14_18960 [Sphingomonas sp. AOB5]|uniref:hypothetical protein n=1 Tax=Sphingomonas sp. AOB5 TaxID=3034017 RepID=UPI0023F9B74D|nr:hypothetical protein [Sphingomonas sp. AOB5]MDF7777346.1 hypothetical protein [Sphingomonas sp. AOB5]
MIDKLKPWAPILAVAGIFTVIAFNQSAPPAAAPIEVQTNTDASSPRVDQAAVEAMKKKLLAQAQVVDLVYSKGGPVQWQVGTYMKGSGVGYAETICMDLKDAGLVDERTSVRMVNMANPAARRGDFRGASIGHVRCRDGEDLGV